MEGLSSLVARAQAGDLAAYGEVVRRLQDMAYGYACAVLGDLHLAEDATQECFMDLARQPRSVTRSLANSSRARSTWGAISSHIGSRGWEEEFFTREPTRSSARCRRRA